MNSLAISGIGIVCPGMFGREAFVRASSEGQAAEDPCRVSEFALEALLGNARSFRRVAGATKFTLAAAALAITDAGFSLEAFGGEEAGLVIGVTHGALTYSTRFHRELLQDGPLGASPLHFSESVLNAPAGNAAIAFRIQGPVHTLIGEEPVGTQALDLAASLLHAGQVDRCLVAGTEEWSDIVAHAYGQIRRATRGGEDPDGPPLLSEGAVVLVLESEEAAERRGATPHALVSGWELGRCRAAKMEEEIAEIVREAFRRAVRYPAEADHVLPPSGRYRGAAARAIALARGDAAGPPRPLDLRSLVGHPIGAANLLQVAASAAFLSLGRVGGPGLVVSAGIERTVSAVVLSKAGQARTQVVPIGSLG